jgi:hypothetical protein
VQEETVVATVLVLVGLFGAVLLLGLVSSFVGRRLRARAAARQVASGAYGFPVVADAPAPVQPIGTGPGRYRVAGVVAETKVDVTLHVHADSPANAKVKAELSGVVVTDVTKVD